MLIEMGDIKDGKKKTGKCFADLFLKLVTEMGSSKPHHWKVTNKNPKIVCKKWKLNHNTAESVLYWTHKEQQTMESLHGAIYRTCHEKLHYPLPCTGTAGRVEGVSEKQAKNLLG